MINHVQQNFTLVKNGMSNATAPNICVSNIVNKDEFVKEKSYSTNFTGCTNAFKKGVRPLEHILKEANGKMAIVGSIPNRWITKMTKETRRENIMAIYAAFRKAFKPMNNCDGTETSTDLINQACEILTNT